MNLGKRPMKDWVARYAASHQHPVNRICHLVGIPLITASLPLSLGLIAFPGFWPAPAAMFALGWVLQFAGHAVEGKPPEFLRDWRFLFVGLHWWLAKVRRRR